MSQTTVHENIFMAAGMTVKKHCANLISGWYSIEYKTGLDWRMLRTKKRQKDKTQV